MSLILVSIFMYSGEATVQLKKDSKVITGGGKCSGFPLKILLKTILKFYLRKDKHG